MDENFFNDKTLSFGGALYHEEDWGSFLPLV